MARPIRIAMWSGPRNISTALMRSWGSRRDTAVIDEPFYARYLKKTGKLHPGSQLIVTQSPTDAYKIIEALTGAIPQGKSIFYQKQMTHHLLPDIDRGWIESVTNCFLIRDPAEVITSYIKKQGDPSFEDLGFGQQLEIFEWIVRRTISICPVIDAGDVLKNPERILRLLCQAIGVAFDPAMLSWQPGFHETDGIWAKYWYGEVAKTTSFQPYRPHHEPVPERFRKIHDRCLECYEKLYQYRLY